MPLTLHPFYMIRHGETVANKEDWFSGSIDTQLTDTGIAQAHSAQRIISSLTDKPDVIIHSALSRARDTARIINAPLDLPMIEDKDYGEMFVGDWQGQPRSTSIDKWKAYIDPPNGERFDDFFDRIKQVKTKHLNAGHRMPLIVCHGGVFRAFAILYGIHTKRVLNCTLYRFEPKPQQVKFPWQVTYFDANGDEHIAEDFQI